MERKGIHGFVNLPIILLLCAPSLPKSHKHNYIRQVNEWIKSCLESGGGSNDSSGATLPLN